ncbi:Methyltransferase domain-containing protein [Methylobacterium pseudosasicola]|uniref:Methyltransferase domain-containing protein n=2 Tax=Methylobacterium pseudosasicola TaxID=582667 RepID=A0A1I4NN51_9HYPH|nr:Methyltransferase domain-containing protein [Methylobacterium pseudosasicola]
MLTTFGAVDAVEFDAGARAIAARRSGIPVQACALPHDLPVRDGAYDLIVLLDVLEHIEDDQATLCALRRKLKQDGRLLVTVPALPWLWSHHDDLHHHKRRYTKRSLELAAAAAEFKIAHIGYFNTFLFPIALVRRLIAIVYSRPTQDDRMPTRLLNAILSRIFSSERHIIGRAGLPVGLSLYAVLSDGR